MFGAWLEPTTKGIVYSAVLAAIGAASLRWILLERAGASLSADTLGQCHARAERVAMMAAVVAVIGLALRLWAHTTAAFGLAASWSWTNLVVIGFESAWGQGWQIQCAAAIALLVVSAWSAVARSFLAPAATVALGASMPLTGHAAREPIRIVLHACHVLGGGLWLGTLAVVGSDRSEHGRSVLPALLRGLAPLAVAGALALVGSGSVQAWAYLGELSNLWRTEYGFLLVAKCLLAGGIALVGALNWRHLHWQNADNANTRFIAIELALAVGAILVTSWLSETAHPG
jgi:putative copper export protein